MARTLEELKGCFWTNEKEMEQEIEELGYDILDGDYENLYIMDIDEREEDKPETIKLKLIRAKNTIAIEEIINL